MGKKNFVAAAAGLLAILSILAAAHAQSNARHLDSEELVLYLTDQEGSSYFYDASSIRTDGSGSTLVPIIIARSDAAAHSFMREAHKRYLPYYTYAITLVDCRRDRFQYKAVAHFTSTQTLAEELSGSGWIETRRAEHMEKLSGIVCSLDTTQKAPEQMKPSKGPRATSGTGFLINAQGMVLTNYHVVEGAKTLTALQGDKRYPLKILAYDAESDLAVLTSSIPGPNHFIFRGGREARHGEEVITIGFPMPDVLSLDISTTTGIVSSLAGVGNDQRVLQFTAPIQPGNSGGPLLDRYGTVIGVVVAKLDAITAAEQIHDIPQNVNFAIKAQVVCDFLTKAKIGFNTQAPETKREVEDIIFNQKSAVVLIVNQR